MIHVHMFARTNSAAMATSTTKKKSQKIQTASSCKLILEQKIDCGFITETVSNVICYIDVKKKKISIKKIWRILKCYQFV